MLFPTTEFIFAFLPATLLVVGLFVAFRGRHAGFWALAVASIIFYANWRWSDLGVIAVSILVNFAVAQILSRSDIRHRLAILWAGIALNLGALAFYKYTNFVLENVGRQPLDIVLPLAISFYSFQQIAFIVDIYHRRAGRIPFLNYVVTVLFFPHLIAGPLIHYQAIMEQFERRLAVNAATILAGLPIFAIGLVKKVAIADPLATVVDPLFHKAQNVPLEFVSAWVAALGYTAQLYFDFSGYSDMAIGLGMMFGIMLPINFRSPYKAMSIIDFWRRWHITLSSFLRDYLYIPLGGSQVSRPRWYANLMIVMLLGGLWHGAGWTFVIWGAMHGSYLVVNHLWRNNVGPLGAAEAWLKPAGAVLTFSAVVAGWVVFKSPNLTTAGHVFQGMAGQTFASLPGELLYFFPSSSGRFLGITCNGLGLAFSTLMLALVALTLAYLIIFFCPNTAEIYALDKPDRFWDRARPALSQALAQASLVGSALFASAFGVLGAAPSAFIYFRF